MFRSLVSYYELPEAGMNAAGFRVASTMLCRRRRSSVYRVRFRSSCLFPLLLLFSRYDLLIVRGCSSTRSYSTMFCQPVGYERTGQVFGSLEIGRASCRARVYVNELWGLFEALGPRALEVTCV